MNYLLQFIVLLPIFSFLLSAVIPKSSEVWLSRVAYGTFGLHLIAVWVLVGLWAWGDFAAIKDLKEIVLYRAFGYEYLIDLHFDEITAFYAVVGSFLSFMVAIYSRVYLHREPGYKRFFNTVHLLFVGYMIIIFSGNLETLFIGWEFLGISSFLLIAFYRDRYLPVRNAFKVYSLYRLGDVGLILAMWLAHHFFHGNVTFSEIADNPNLVVHGIEEHNQLAFFISFMLLIAAAVKSAQLPFSSWLPRAMEGPTPSSAIFYGSLSVHLGVFLLLRTYPIWEHQLAVRIAIGVLGILTAIMASGIARVQSAVKSQIAYASIAQIGVIFVEVAFGFKYLALIHFAGNAFLRTYQLLVSPSVVTYLIREQFYNFTQRPRTLEQSIPKRLMYSFYVLSLKEWNLDQILHRYYREPLKKIGSFTRFLNNRILLWSMVPMFIVGFILQVYQDEIPVAIHNSLPPIFSIIGLAMVLRAYIERKSARSSWLLVISNNIWVALAISFNEHYTYDHTVLYLSGSIVAGAVGLWCLARLKKLENSVDLDRHQGHAYEHGTLALVFLFACLGLTGFPITPTFIGEDLIFSHIKENQILLAVATALSMVIDGLAIIRIYTKIFMGAHIKNYHSVAYRSS